MNRRALISLCLPPIFMSLVVGACAKQPVVTIEGGQVTGDPYSSRGATVTGAARVKMSAVASAEDVFSPEGSRKVLLRAPGGAGGGNSVIFDCICKSGGTNLNCEEKCTIDIRTGQAECTCTAIGCQNCAADLGLSSNEIGFIATLQTDVPPGQRCPAVQLADNVAARERTYGRQ